MKTTTIVLIIILFLASFIGGAAFWFYQKGAKLANRTVDINSSSNLETPSSPSSNVSDLIMPTADVDGKDLPDISRYPKSVRTSYYASDDNKFFSIDYMVKGKSAAIFNYYKKDLADWNLISENETMMSFSKKNKEAAIEVTDENKTYAITQYSISYTINAL